MKKLLCLALACIFILSFCSCVAEEQYGDISDDVLEQILVSDHSSKSWPNYGTVISDDIVESEDAGAPRERTVCVYGEETVFKYEKTCYFPVNDLKYHVYTLESDNNKSAWFSEDGRLMRLSFEFAKVDLSQAKSDYELRLIVEAELSKYVDLSDYNNLSIYYSPAELGSISYTYYNTVSDYMDDYITDSAEISILKDGTVYGLFITDIAEQSLEPFYTINRDLENHLINRKLYSIFNTEEFEYISCEYSLQNYYVIYNGEPYIRYHVNPILFYDGERDRDGITLLIPVSLLTSDQDPNDIIFVH